MSLRSAIFGGPAHRRATVLIGVVLLLVAATILAIGANSPYTHANLSAAYDQRYERTEQIVVGPPAEFGGFTPSVAAGTDPVERGATLYVTAGCVGCHALDGRGGAVAKAIAGVDLQTLMKKVRQGTAGMPPFSASGLSDAQIAEIGAYLRSLTAAAPQPASSPASTQPPASAPAPSASPGSATAATDAILVLGKTVFETAGGAGCQDCHGSNAKGQQTKDGTNAPNIRGTTEQKLRDALAGGAALMTFIKLSDQEIEAVIRYLRYLDEQ